MAYLPWNPRPAQALRAELVGSNTATAAGLTACGRTPLLELCRLLLQAGHDPKTSLVAWRGKTLCLRVSAIGLAAQLTIDGRSYFSRLQNFRIAPPVRQNGAHHHYHHHDPAFVSIGERHERRNDRDFSTERNKFYD